ncbi:hypothetical protein ACIBCA_24620 [Kitasatospora sp. NPDC051170]|uniref:hypothetical protein n=1 Tax=Kitasatospora sp. NPDC051170 TaxID=3364056 RepID=UPI00379519CB
MTRSLFLRGVLLAALGIVLVFCATLGWLPLGDNPFVRHAPQLAGILMIGQGALWVARSRSDASGSDGSGSNGPDSD